MKDDELSRAPSELNLAEKEIGSSKKSSLILGPEDKWIGTLDVSQPRQVDLASSIVPHIFRLKMCICAGRIVSRCCLLPFAA